MFPQESSEPKAEHEALCQPEMADTNTTKQVHGNEAENNSNDQKREETDGPLPVAKKPKANRKSSRPISIEAELRQMQAYDEKIEAEEFENELANEDVIDERLECSMGPTLEVGELSKEDEEKIIETMEQRSVERNAYLLRFLICLDGKTSDIEGEPTIDCSREAYQRDLKKYAKYTKYEECLFGDYVSHWRKDGEEIIEGKPRALTSTQAEKDNTRLREQGLECDCHYCTNKKMLDEKHKKLTQQLVETKEARDRRKQERAAAKHSQSIDGPNMNLT